MRERERERERVRKCQRKREREFSVILSGTRAAVGPNWDTYRCKAAWKQLSVSEECLREEAHNERKQK